MKEKSTPFAARFQLILIIMLLVSLVLIAQQFSKDVYKVGLVLLVITTIFQIGASNVPSTANAKQTARIMAIAFAIVIVVFVVSIILTPYLINLGRG